MNMTAIREHAIRVIAMSTGTGTIPKIALFLKCRKWPASGRMRLFGRHGGPFGMCVSEEADGVLAVFDARSVIDAIDKVIA